MRAALASVWAVILTVGIVQAANGVQTDLLSVRAGLEGFSAAIIGVVMSCYYVGYTAAPLASHFIVARIGHVRVILAGSLVAALAIAIHGVVVNPFAWAS